MTESKDHEQKPGPDTANLLEKPAENDPESAKAIAEEALKKVETLLAENTKLRKKLKSIDEIFSRYEHLDGYMEKYGFNTELERDMWRAIRQITKE
ncbi:MAG: hypothetical protein ABFD57_05435 [Smithella sp.]|nr:hypothetical protein [Syntrophaceae bacterium]